MHSKRCPVQNQGITLKTFLYRIVLEFAEVIISLKHYSDRHNK